MQKQLWGTRRRRTFEGITDLLSSRGVTPVLLITIGATKTKSVTIIAYKNTVAAHVLTARMLVTKQGVKSIAIAQRLRTH